MQKIISFPISAICYLLFLVVLVLFHPIQWVCFRGFGYEAHKKSVDYLNFFLLKIIYLSGSTCEAYNLDLVPKDAPLIIVANHQSLYDIIMINWKLRAIHPKFVSKKELGKWIPSVSYNLQHGGSVLIDRKDPKQALPVIKSLAEYIQQFKRAAVIFPEGTRSKNGTPKEFAQSGLKILCKYAPTAFVVPVSINNSWKIFRYGFFPLGLGNAISLTIHSPISVKDYSFEEIMNKTQSAIIQGIKN